MEKLPIVAIVGRQNVGKSSLLNALAQRRLSIVDPMPGVTRDRVSAIVTVRGSTVQLVDTAGLGLSKADAFHAPVERQIAYAVKSADLVVFVVDVQEGLTSLDRETAARLRRADKAVLLVANKADHPGMDVRALEFAELGLGEAFCVSCAHRRGVGDLMEKILLRLPAVRDAKDEPLRMAIVGKRNVGKSTLVNALTGEESVIVSEVPGTTRDAVDVHLVRDGKRYILVDTAGLRKKQRVADSVELFSQVRTQEAVERADVVVLMIEVTERVSELDKRIGALVELRKKPVLIVLNKWDLVPKGFDAGKFRRYLDQVMPVLSYAPVLMVSALKRERVWEVVRVAAELHAQAGVKIATPDLNRVVERAQRERSPGTRGGKKPPKIFYATQSRVHPPTFNVFVNHPSNFTDDYIRYLERKFREYLPFHEVPIRLALRAKGRR
jgi:GTP-binding protein